MSVIGFRGGHSKNCIGAVGKLNEYVECQKVYAYAAKLLVEAGNTVIDCNSSGSSANAELSEGVRKANAANVDFFASVHMNAGGGTGCEVWAYNSSSSKAVSIGKNICANISSQLGIPNRGVKYNASFYELRNTKCQAIIVETLFCDSAVDVSKYNVEKLARSIAHAIDSRVPLVAPKDPIVKADYVIVYPDGADPDRSVAQMVYMVVKAKGHSAYCVTATEYAKNTYGDLRGTNTLFVGGGMKGKFNHWDAWFNGSDRYQTAYQAYDYLKKHSL